MKKLLLFLILVIGTMSVAWPQIDDVTLVVSGEGVTKDEATIKALRSAIEQAFGVFVSANTEILNDELVKDEIATVSSGNIKEYTELSAMTKANGNTEVSLKATISVKKLTSYAKGHGSSCEFAGATFAANLKLIELNRDNTTKAFQNLNRQLAAIEGASVILPKNDDTKPLRIIFRDMYSCDLKVGEPKADGSVVVELNYYSTEKGCMIGDLVFSTLQALAVPSDQVSMLLDQGVKLFGYKIADCFDPREYQAAYGKIWSPYPPIADFIDGSPISSGPDKKIWFYSPLLLPTIYGQSFELFDNLGNHYDGRLSCNEYSYDWHVGYSTIKQAIKVQDEFFTGKVIRENIQQDRYEVGIFRYTGHAIEVVEFHKRERTRIYLFSRILQD